MMSDFSQQLNNDSDRKKVPAVSVDSLGAWEKHTKGIGSKLLKKFGFSGRLGAKEDGVSRPIEVVMRPHSQGLGFGDFTEAAALTENKKFEAEWRGVEYVEEPKAKATGNKKKNSGNELEEIAEGRHWKRGKRVQLGMTAAELYAKFEQDEAERVNSAKSQLVLDLRGKDSKVIDVSQGVPDDEGGPINENIVPKLGQELLHNINLVTGIVEKEIADDYKRKNRFKLLLEETNSNLKEIIESLQQNESKLERIETMYQIVDRIATKHEEMINSAATATPVAKPITLDAICSLFIKLVTQFRLEVTLYGLLSLIVPLSTPIILRQLSEWNPLENPHELDLTFSYLTPLLKTIQQLGDRELEPIVCGCMQTLATSCALPKVRRVLTNEWDPTDPSPCLALTESMKALISPNDYDQLLDLIVFPKLQQGVAEWSPSRRSDGNKSIHDWLAPWMEHLSSKLCTLFPDIRRKYGQILQSTSFSLDEHMILDQLLKWREIFDATSMENMVVRSLIPKLVSYIRTMDINSKDQITPQFATFLNWVKLTPESHALALLVGEFFPRWLHVLARRVSESRHPRELCQVVDWYENWRKQIPSNLLANEVVVRCVDGALNLLAVGIEVCSVVNSAKNVDMSLNLNAIPVNLLLQTAKVFANPETDSYFRVMEATKLAERTKQNIADLTKSSSMFVRSARNSSGGMASVPFKVVVETFATKNGVLFTPRFGPGSQLSDGQQLWQFGSITCYMEHDVMFVEDSKMKCWMPISLEDLLLKCQD